ncbi:MAG: tetratricopeptide repeat protein [Alphaproteobacteria bacterium]|nr:tetratricopeptide repeat protein [Alphaproteobacteria bacterium]
MKLFPSARSAGNFSEAPPELPPLSAPDPIAAPPTAQTAPAAGQPLRVVIPNIKEQEKTRVADVKKARPKSAGRQEPSEASSLRKFSEELYAKAQNALANGVLIADWSNTPIVRTMFRPNIPFAPLPLSWQVAAVDPANPDASVAVDTRAIAMLTPTTNIAMLAPAAGAAETINTQPPAPITPATPAAPTAPVATAAPTAPVAVASDPSEPAPTLSSQSKAIIDKVPAVADKKPETAAAKPVEITHAKETNVLSAAPAPQANEALGVKVGSVRTKVDVNYELERAYNALIAGQSETAIQIYEDILTGSPKNKEALFGLASTYHRLGQIDIARSLYGKLLEIDPKHRDGLNNFLVLLADEAPQEALSQMERLETQNPGFSPIPAQMAIIYQKLGDQDKAVDKMYRALAIAPENITYRYNLAIMLDKSGKYDEAGKLYTQLLDSHAKGGVIPGDATKIQQRLTFIRSNSSR